MIMTNKFKSNELYHYGVLGMKWGVHRAKKGKPVGKVGSYLYTDSNKTRMAKELAKSGRVSPKRAKKALDKAAREQKAVLNRYDSQSKGKKLAQLFLMGSRGTAYYNEYRIKGDGRVKAYLKARMSNTLPGALARGVREASEVANDAGIYGRKKWVG